MLVRKLIFFLFQISTVSCFAQQNFSYSPEKPRPGETITITYSPSGDIVNTAFPLEAAVYFLGGNTIVGQDLLLERKGNKYISSFTTDTASNFVFFGFSADGKFDNNFDKGYYIHLYEKGVPKTGSYENLGMLSYYYGSRVGLSRNPKNALQAFDKEYERNPELKKKNLQFYFGALKADKKEEAIPLIQKEIEAEIKKGLKDEVDYDNIIALYNLAMLPEQAKFITTRKKEKFPDGDWVISEKIQAVYSEQDISKKEQLLAEIISNIENDNKWEKYKGSISFFQSQLLNAYAAKKDWEKFRATAKKINDNTQLASVYNNMAWEMQKTNKDLAMAEEMSAFATNYAKEQWKNPTTTKPAYMTEKQWKKNNELTYAMYADTYGMVLYRLGQYKKGYSYAKDAAMLIHNGEDPDQNNTYALLAEKISSPKKIKPELEQFVKDGKATSEIKNILKRVYTKKNKSENGFEKYITGLQEESRLKMLNELKKSMLDQVSPSFALVNLDGKRVDITELKGKVVVVDFWATWCGPCKASFPGMQKLVNKYKDDQNVKFIFVDTWENAEDKKKGAQDFITANKYSFDVLLDNDSKVVEQFKVEGIPTKFVIDKSGKIRFKSVGFDGSDDKLIEELTAMIDIASGQDKKSF